MSSMVMAANEMCRGGVEEYEVEDVFGEGGIADEVSSLDVGMEEGEPYEENCVSHEELEEGQGETRNITAQDVLAMEFDNPEEATRFYDQYSRGKGFAMRVGKKLKNKNGDIIRYTYMCNREGFRQKKWLEKQDRKREHKVITRCGCLAEMRISQKADSNKWQVARFVEDHNHELVPLKFVEYLSCNRKISDVDIAYMDSLKQVGISIPKIYESIAAQAGGFNLVPFTKRDMYNEVRRQRALQNGDVNAALRLFETSTKVDEKLFWRYQVGEENNMCDLFWSDGQSQDDYAIFGDVLAFDATYGRNKYNLPVIVFSGVNHHNQTCVFAAAMVSCETQESYVWVLRQFLACMGGKQPKAVITDGDKSMRIAISKVFPMAHHRLCAWHLLKNATVNVCKPKFTQMLRYCMLADLEMEEFEGQWEAMLEECGVREVDWVKDLYSKKLSWATAYIRGRFFAGLRTTSRCESLHAKMGRFVEGRYGILEFVTNFQRCVNFLRDNEEELEFRSCYGTPVLQTLFPELEKSGAVYYTRELFFRYRESLRRSVRVTILDRIDREDSCMYITQKYRRPERKWNVIQNTHSGTFQCSCLRMESFGLPCAHILAVLVRLDVDSLPKSLVLKRWAKTAKCELWGETSGERTIDDDAIYRSRVGAFLQHCKRFARVACFTEGDFKQYLEFVVQETIKIESKHGIVTNAAAGTSQPAEDSVRDPIGVRTKGTGRGNVPFGSRGVKRRKCSTCGVVGHRRTRCPNGPPTSANSTQEACDDPVPGSNANVAIADAVGFVRGHA